MKKFYLMMAALFLAAACNTPQKAAQKTDIQPSKVYVDSVKTVSQDGRAALEIFGHFPDSCTYLEGANHSLKNGAIQLQLIAQRQNAMCTQMLVPFSFVYNKLTEEEISGHSKVVVNGTAYPY
ncbi:MAG TPA: hypothetical protein VFG39_01140 [Balneolaceae bacterium]|nr:hypothetical protein [Balneolaceae bacterium]